MESERLIFRIMDDEDKDDFYEIFSSEKVGDFIKPMTRQQVENYFEKRKSKLFPITMKKALPKSILVTVMRI